MKSFNYQRVTSTDTAVKQASTPRVRFLAGGTNLIDLMKYGVEAPSTLLDINHLELAQISSDADGGVTIGALVKNSDLADHPTIKTKYPLLSEALLSGASPQLRNMATTGGNLMQRTRCYYFTDISFPACNKRKPGSGCAAITGYNRIHAILGQTDKGSTSAETCIATHPSDMCVALAALSASILVQGPHGKRTILFADFHRLPGSSPAEETALRPGELILAIHLPAPKFARNSHYLKVRDRNSYAFALISVAAGMEIENGVIKSVGLALGGVALKPWRHSDAERLLLGQPPEPERFQAAEERLLNGAEGYEHNSFKISLAKQSIVRALLLASGASMKGPTV